MRRYETIVIMDPDLSAEQREPILKRVADVISQENGYLAVTDEWGNRKLAYEIKTKPRGYYTRFDFCGTSAAVDEIERFFRIDDRVLKYMTVLLDSSADIEKIKEEIASTQKTNETSPETVPPTDTRVSPEPAETTQPLAPETPPASAQDPAQHSENPADEAESQKLEPQADESQAAASENKEEIK